MLPEFIADLAGRKWKWSYTDCTMILSDWVFKVHGVDLGKEYRGTYSDQRQCSLLLRRAGGLRRHLGNCLSAIQVVETQTPQRGDVGIVRVPVPKNNRAVIRSIGAICLAPDRVAIFTPDCGLLILSDTKPIVAWRI